MLLRVTTMIMIRHYDTLSDTSIIYDNMAILRIATTLFDGDDKIIRCRHAA